MGFFCIKFKDTLEECARGVYIYSMCIYWSQSGRFGVEDTENRLKWKTVICCGNP